MRVRQANYLSLVDNFIQEVQDSNNALGDYSDSHKWHFEFQVGSHLVWIVFDKSNLYSETITQNISFLRELWLNGKVVLDIAESQSRKLLKDFWSLQDEFDALPDVIDKKSLDKTSIGNDTNRLGVNGLHINLDDKTVIYQVFENYSYEYNQEKITFAEDDYFKENPIKITPPELPDDCWINIEYQNGEFTVVEK